MDIPEFFGSWHWCWFWLQHSWSTEYKLFQNWIWNIVARLFVDLESFSISNSFSEWKFNWHQRSYWRPTQSRQWQCKNVAQVCLYYLKLYQMLDNLGRFTAVLEYLGMKCLQSTDPHWPAWSLWPSHISLYWSSSNKIMLQTINEQKLWDYN